MSLYDFLTAPVEHSLPVLLLGGAVVIGLVWWTRHRRRGS